MTTEATLTTGQPGNAGTQQAGASGDGHLQTNNTAEPTKKSEPNKDELDKLIAKAREDEKKKVFGKLSDLEKSKDEAVKLAKKLEEELASTRADLESVKKGETSELDLVARELKALKDQSSQWQKALEEVSKSAEKKIRDLELETKKVKLLSEEKLAEDLHEFVSGQSEEEIRESIKALKAKEEAIKAAAKAAVEAEYAGKLPGPLAADGAQGRQAVSRTSVDRTALTKMSKDEFTAYQKKQLDEAMKKVGL